MTSTFSEHFERQYQTHLKHLKLQGLQPKTIDAYARAIRCLGAYFAFQIDDLSEAQLLDYFSARLASHSWSAVKLDLYGLKFYTEHVLRKPWVMPRLIKPPKRAPLPEAGLSGGLGGRLQIGWFRQISPHLSGALSLSGRNS